MKIAFLWWFDKAGQVYDNWRDGLRAAIELLEKDHKVSWIIGKEYPEDIYDAIIFWDDSNSSFFDRIDHYHGKKALCLTTDPHNFENLRKLDVVYCESTPVYEAVRSQGIRAIKAFGTDTDFYSPDDTVKKDIEVFYPATFSPWKKQGELSDVYQERLLCVGTLQPDGKEEYERCIKNGSQVKVGYFPAETILSYYQRAKKVIIPAVHGSERTVLEAMSCNILPVVEHSNMRACSYVKECKESGLTPREFVVKNYSAKKYAEDILRGLQ